jgi:ubiquitin-like 1-activating enzyme E1 A
MSNARVLYLNLTGVTCEMMKNLVLAGVAAVVCDPRPYPDAVREMPSSFFRASEMEKIVADRKKEGEPDAKRMKGMTVAAAVAPEIDELNPLLVGRNSIEERSIASLSDDYFGQFDAVVASRLTVDEAKRISLAIQKYHGEKKSSTEGEEDNTLFIVTDTFGLDGCAHLDFGSSHLYRRELGKDKLSDPIKIDPYVSMVDMLGVPLAKATGRWDKIPPRSLVLQRLLMDFWEEYIKTGGVTTDEEKTKEKFVTFATQWMSCHEITPSSLEIEEGQTEQLKHLAGVALHPEVSPVAAVLGGVLGNEVIKSLTRKGEPANNVLLFSGLDGGCRSFVLCGDESN